MYLTDISEKMSSPVLLADTVWQIPFCRYRLVLILFGRYSFADTVWL